MILKKKTKDKLKIFQLKYDEKHVDSFWYDGQIARLDNCILIANGDIRVSFPGSDVWYKNQWAVEEAYQRKYTDKDIHKLYQTDASGNNNWFEIVSAEGDSVMGDVGSTYDEGIKMLKQYYKEGIYDS